MHFKDYIRNLPAYKPAKLTSAQAANMVKLSSNENALGPSPRAVAAIQQALPRIHLYPDSTAAALREVLANRAELSPDMVLCSNGSDEMVLLLCMAFLREGDDVVMAEGTFISYLLRTLAMGARPVRVPLHTYTHNLDALAGAITPQTRLLFVCNPNNPTGTTVGADEMRRLLEQVPDHVLVVVDEAYIEFASRPDFPDLLPELRGGRSNVLLLRTFAKMHGLAGLRLGYAFGHPDVLDYLHRARPVFNVNALAQVAGVAAVDDTEHITRSRAYAEECRAFFAQELAALGLHPIPTETNFMAVNVGDDAAVAEGLRERGYTVTPLTGWGVPGCIRVSFGTTEQNQGFIVALRDTLAQGSAPNV
jgi:histidinol-phosphate aminotransferase